MQHTARPADSELVSTADWCPNFLRILQSFSDDGMQMHDGRIGPIFWNDYLIIERAAQVQRLSHTLRAWEVESLKGLEYFPNLEELYLDLFRSSIQTVDFSHNAALIRLDIISSELEELDISNNHRLQTLTIESSSLQEIDVANNRMLSHLRITYSSLATLDLSNNANLHRLDVSNNQLESLDISNNNMLEWLDVSGNNMHSPDDVLGWQEIGLSWQCKSDEKGVLIFWPQNALWVNG